MFSLLGLVLIGLGVVGLADLGPLRASRPRAGAGIIRGARPGMVVLAGCGLIVVDLVLAVLVIVVLGGSSAGAQTMPAQAEDGAVPVVSVTVDPRPADERVKPLLVDDLPTQAVLRIEAREFPADVTGMVWQCIEGDQRRCSNQQSVRFDGRGRADIQYLVTDTIEFPSGSAARCGQARVRCTVELSARNATAVIETFFGTTVAPPGRLEVSPRSGIGRGDEVTVSISGFPPGEHLVATVCAAPAVRGDRCGQPAPEVAMTVGADGSARATVVLDLTVVGADRVACGRRTVCRMVVLSDDTTTRANSVNLGLVGAPGPTYDTGRVVFGLLVAAGLLGAASYLVATGDWGPPGEADGSAIDDAVLADLDAEAAAFDDQSLVAAAALDDH